MAVVTFDPAQFKVNYPEFSAVPDTRLEFFFSQAVFYINNTDASIIQDITHRALALNMMTAHIGVLSGALSEKGIPLPVGRVQTAQQGSVNAEFKFDAPPGSYQWFIQTQYGAAAWQVLRSQTLMRYIPNPTCY